MSEKGLDDLGADLSYVRKIEKNKKIQRRIRRNKIRQQRREEKVKLSQFIEENTYVREGEEEFEEELRDLAENKGLNNNNKFDTS
jgi:hypothetical protein